MSTCDCGQLGCPTCEPPLIPGCAPEPVQQPAGEEQVWAQLICPVPVQALAALCEIAPAGAVIRPGGQTFHEGSFHNVVEVVVQ
jgi:hypothetical protein